MSTKTAEEPKAAEQPKAGHDAPEGAAAGGGMKLKIIAVVAIVVTVQVIATWFFLGGSGGGAEKHGEAKAEGESHSSEHAAASSHGHGASAASSHGAKSSHGSSSHGSSSSHGHGSEPADDDPESSSGLAEIQIGNGFRCTNSNATDGNGTIHIDFKLIALVPAKLAEHFKSKLKEHEFRIRQAVEKVARSNRLEDLNDPTLSKMKRLICEEINKLLHKTYITEVVISDFTTMEQ